MISIFKKTHHDTNYDEDGDDVQKVAKKTVATQWQGLSLASFLCKIFQLRSFKTKANVSFPGKISPKSHDTLQCIEGGSMHMQLKSPLWSQQEF